MFLTELNFIAITVRKICCYETIRENTQTFFHDFFLDRFTFRCMCLTVPSLSFSFYYRTETRFLYVSLILRDACFTRTIDYFNERQIFQSPRMFVTLAYYGYGTITFPFRSFRATFYVTEFGHYYKHLEHNYYNLTSFQVKLEIHCLLKPVCW